MLTDFLIAIIVLLILNYVELSIPRWGIAVSTLFITSWLLFSLANVANSSAVATFYMFMAGFTLLYPLVGFVKIQAQTSKLSLSQFKLGTFKLNWFLVFLIGLGFAALILSTTTATSKASVIGTPNFSIAQTSTMSTLNSGLIGFIENRFFFLIFEFLIFLSVFIPFLRLMSELLPLFLTSILFGVFHIAAYSAQSVNIISAGLIMSLWLALYYFFDGELITCNHHFIHNSWISSTKFSVIGG